MVPPGEDASVAIVRKSGLFDQSWYLSQVDGPLPTGVDPIRHYLAHGAPAGLSPHPAFVASWYLTQVRATPGYGSRMKIAKAPLLHYLTVGARRRLSPHPGFDAEAYLVENSDAEGERFGPLAHFLRTGDRSCLSVDEPDLKVPQGIPAQRRTTEEFVAAAREAARRDP